MNRGDGMLATMVVAALVVAAALALGSPQDASPAEEHTTAGEQALEAGDDATAANEFVAAYRLLEGEQRTGEIAIMLVDEGVAAGVRAWERSGDAAYLEQARELLVAHAKDLEGVEDVAARRQEILQRLLEIDAKLGVKDPEVVVPAPAARTPAPKRSPWNVEPPPKPLVRQRIAGIVLIPVGAAMFFTGLGFSIRYIVSGREFGENLREDNATYQSECNGPVEPGSSCEDLEQRVGFWRDQGRRANTLAVVTGTFAAFGLAVAVTGIALLASADRKLKRLGHLAVRPTVGGVQVRF